MLTKIGVVALLGTLGTAALGGTASANEPCVGPSPVVVTAPAQVQPSVFGVIIGLPGIDGWQTGRILKADPATTNIPLIAFSARVDSTADLAGRATFDGYIRKPVSPLELAKRIGAYLELLA